MRDITKKSVLPFFFPGALKSLVFVILIGLALGFWFYTQMIFERVKQYQKIAIRTQIEIYVSLIDPSYSDDSGIESGIVQKLIQKIVLESPYRVILSDEMNNPIEGSWRNVGIDPGDTTREAREELGRIMKKMDHENKPEPFRRPQLGGYKTDQLVVYELPPSRMFPVIVTDGEGRYLYGRNLPEPITGKGSFRGNIDIIDAVSPPVQFTRENSPQLVFHGANYMGRWPIVIMNAKTREPIYWKGLADAAENDTTISNRLRIAGAVELMREQGVSYRVASRYPVTVYRNGLIHYGDLEFLFLIKWLPFIQFAVIILLLTVGFIGLKNITNAEQRSIWVGMAKETAHQLGTPISSISGWLELLKTDQDPAFLEQAITEMEYDVKRLTRVAARFSNIGSKPELQPMVLSDVIEEVLDYYRARAPHMGRSVRIEGRYSGPMPVMGNHELLNWAFENLVKNSLASIDHRDGRITVTGTTSKDMREVVVDITDNGKGIPYQEQGKIMKPGYTTKKRGWGLGLSLVKRIIEEYHGGKIDLLESKPGAGTTFRLVLPAVNRYSGVMDKRPAEESTTSGD
jgi:signal transduction histidine kinase